MANFNRATWGSLQTYNSVRNPKVIVGRRCVVQGCSNTLDHESGISVHVRLINKGDRDKWVRFVRTHRVNFSPSGRFMICSKHFDKDCFERSLYMEGWQRTLRPGSVPTIWTNQTFQEPPSSRSVRKRKKVSTCSLLFTSCNCKYIPYYANLMNSATDQTLY